MNIAISGRGGSGKDEAATWLGQNTSLIYAGSTSFFARRLVFEQWGHLYYTDQEACYADRSKHRITWATLIDQYNEGDLTRLYRDCLTVQDILTGIRRRDEFEAVVAAGMVDLTLWIERDVEPDPTQGYWMQDCDLAIANNGTVEEFHQKLRKFSQMLGVLHGESV